MRSKVIVHIDMDAFFASIEQRDNPRLKGKPVVVGADPQFGKGRGVVSTCSYEARKYGIHSAQPISKAYKLCPHAVFLRGNLKKYSDVSKEIKKIFYDFTPDVESISIDEAFLDITGSYHFYETPENLCFALKKRIQEEVQLTASVGIAPVKMVAKIASDFCKPNGLLRIKEDEVLKFLHGLPVGKLWGVGPQTKAYLNGRGISTVGELAKLSKEELVKMYGQQGLHLYNLAHGIDPREVKADEKIKSVSHEHTFEKDESNAKNVENTILVLSEKISRRLRKKGLKGKAITVKIRLKGFKTYTRSCMFDRHTDLIDDIYKSAKKLFKEFYQQGQEIRLIGVRVSNFENLYVQDDLFESVNEQRSKLVQDAMDQIKDKFGEKAIHRGIG